MQTRFSVYEIESSGAARELRVALHEGGARQIEMRVERNSVTVECEVEDKPALKHHLRERGFFV